MTGRRPAGVGAHRAPTRYRSVVVLGSLAVAVVAGLVAVLVLTGDSPGRPPDDGGSTRTAPTGPTGTDGARDDASAAALLDWVDAELPPGTPLVVADHGTRSRLLRAGADGTRVLAARTADALVVTDGAVPGGAVALARFGDQPALTVVDPAPGEPTAAELDRRQDLAAAVLANPATGATGRAAQVLREAAVDARLLGLISVLVSRLEVGIAEFPVATGEPVDGPPARRVLLDRSAGEPLAPGSPATRRLLAFLDAQVPPFDPDTVEPTDGGVLVGFDYVSGPDAVVTAGAP